MAFSDEGKFKCQVIGKYMEEKHKVVLPPKYKNMLSMQIKKLVLADKLTKVKDSFKLVEGVKKVPAKKPTKPATKTASKLKIAPKSALGSSTL